MTHEFVKWLCSLEQLVLCHLFLSQCVKSETKTRRLGIINGSFFMYLNIEK